MMHSQKNMNLKLLHYTSL